MKLLLELATVTSLTKFGIALAAGLALWPVHCPAEYFGLPNTQDISHSNQRVGLAVGFANGQFFGLDYQHAGVRFSLKTNESVVVELDLGESTLDRATGTSYGLGALYHSNFQFAGLPPAIVKISYHTVSATRAGFSDYEPNVLAVQAMFRDGANLMGIGGLGWYLNTGVHRFSDRVGSEAEFGIGAGLHLPLLGGEAYAGVDLIDEFLVGAGFRISLF